MAGPTIPFPVGEIRFGADIVGEGGAALTADHAVLPTDAFLSSGETPNVPPVREVHNYLYAKWDNQVNYLLQAGIPAVAANIIYRTGDVVRASLNSTTLYQCNTDRTLGSTLIADSASPLWTAWEFGSSGDGGGGGNTMVVNNTIDLPAGVILYSAKTAPDTGYLICNGAAVSRSTYGSLFGAIGITYGAGDGSSTFNVPDLRGEFIRGFDSGRGIDNARVFGSMQTDALRSHTHTLTVVDIGTSNSNNRGITARGSTSGSSGTRTTHASGGTETRPRNVALQPIIKF